MSDVLPACPRCVDLCARGSDRERLEREVRWWRSIIGDAIFGLRHQPELSRAQIAEALANSLVDGMPDDAQA